MNEFPHVKVAGSAIERGRQYGEQARDRVLASVREYGRVFEHYAGWDWATVRAEAARFEAPIAAFRPSYLDEMRGIAEGSGLDLLDVLAINVRTEVMFAAKARQAARSTGPAECSSFAVVPVPGQDGPTLIGQNWDWLNHCTDTVVVLEVSQDDAPDYVTVVEAGLLAKTGMNSSGLGLAANALVTAADAGEPGLPFHLLLRAILDCENVSDALTVLQSGYRSSSANYLLAHADGVAVNAECAPGDFSQVFLTYPDASDRVVLHTNHFLSPRFDGTDVSVWAMPDSPVRLQRLQAGVAAAEQKSLEVFRSLLADHANHPSGICAHPDTRFAELDQGATIASVLMDLPAKTMWLADGNPCTAPYRRLDYSALLAKPSAVAPGGAPGTPDSAAAA